MLEIQFMKPIPLPELDAELCAFARLLAKEQFDVASNLTITLQPMRSGEPVAIVHPGSDIPVTTITCESRLAKPRRAKS